MKVLDEVVRKWGFPEALVNNFTDLNFDFFYNDDEFDDSCKFFVKEAAGKVLFTMEFFMSYSDPKMFLSKPSYDAIKLRYIQTESDELRRQGIAKYYIDKLKTYAKSKGIKYITLEACLQENENDEDPYLNVLKTEDLKAFYTNFSDNEIKFIIMN